MSNSPWGTSILVIYNLERRTGVGLILLLSCFSSPVIVARIQHA